MLVCDYLCSPQSMQADPKWSGAPGARGGGGAPSPRGGAALLRGGRGSESAPGSAGVSSGGGASTSNSSGMRPKYVMPTIGDSIYLLLCPGFSTWILHTNNINSIIRSYL